MHQTTRRSDTIDYLDSMLAELRNMAEAERYELLAYLIGMAHVEAGDILRKKQPLNVRESK